MGVLMTFVVFVGIPAAMIFAASRILENAASRKAGVSGFRKLSSFQDGRFVPENPKQGDI